MDKKIWSKLLGMFIHTFQNILIPFWNISEVHNFFLVKLKNDFFSQTTVFVILNIFWTFYPFWKKKLMQNVFKSNNFQLSKPIIYFGEIENQKGFWFRKSLPNTCPKCNCRANLHHIFVQCPQLSLQRKEISDYCQKEGIHFDLSSILSPPFPITIILKFLQDAGIPISEI